MQNTSIINNPDYIFETSWEVCNKVGGIYTVISTKAPTLVSEYKDNYILIGPDLIKENGALKNEFIEDKFLHRSWIDYAESKGIRVRVGRWNIATKPVVFLVNFISYFSEKDKILADLWNKYKLDSLTGHWDYVEPALFGYATGKVIESFYEFYNSAEDKIIAHFHEWMTGTGILYLKENVPQISTVFTTHATALGRAIAGRELPLYRDMEKFIPETLASEFEIKAKYSLEKLSAINADAFTTVSELTSQECKFLLKKEVDVITPNGFDDSFVPDKSSFDQKRNHAKNKIFAVVEAILQQPINKDSLLVINSGRYEFKNKGIDLFIDALGLLDKSDELKKNIIAFITVPANHLGPYWGILRQLENPGNGEPTQEHFLTHHLNDKENDSVILQIRKNNLLNSPTSKVKIIFVPCYLDGNDGIFNMSYYDLLIGFDLSVFPSYYEPWGYTPLESLAFHIPTITTTLAGFGRWVNDKYRKVDCGITVVERDDNNTNTIAETIAASILKCTKKAPEEFIKARSEAYDISRIALWENLIVHYKNAFGIALEKAAIRSELYVHKQPAESTLIFPRIKREKPTWKKILINPALPEKLLKLQELSKNLWWTWNFDCHDLFEMINMVLWKKCQYNPVQLLESLSLVQLKDLEENDVFMQKLMEVHSRFKTYMEESKEKPECQIAYFSMEYGLHDSLKIFSGGLGVLAGDYLKEASDSNQNLVGVGLLFRYGYFTQNISVNGEQIAKYLPQRFSHLPITPVRDENGKWITVSLSLPGRSLFAKVWVVQVGRIPLYLLDTDIDENIETDRSITHILYGGDWENRFKQELLLGVGGIRLLDKLGITPKIFHCNEGHAAFTGVERLRKLVMEKRVKFNQALEIVRASSLFTTHTPVPAGHDTFEEHILRSFIPHYANRLNISWNEFMGLGKIDKNNPREKFSMSVLAANTSQEMNGVSEIHGRVTRDMFKNMYDGFFANELHIGHVTNGVHYPTWASRKWQEFYSNNFGDGFFKDQSNAAYWEKIYNVSDEEIWNLRNQHRKELMNYLFVRLYEDMTHRQEHPMYILKILDGLNENILTVGFARRFATYKRAHLLAYDLERLQKLAADEHRPIQFIFAGKAHPNDKAGMDLIKMIVELSRKKEFKGNIVFVENYDMELAKMLVQGVDVWLNTPTRPLEASGTSGEKAIMNGVLNFSVLDGWWAEGYKEGAGWALEEKQTFINQQFQDDLDAENIYSTFEEEIVPMFYKRNENNIPVEWVQCIKKSIASINPNFTMKRMLEDYNSKYYTKLQYRLNYLTADNNKKAKEIARWKLKVLRNWEQITVDEYHVPHSTKKPLILGEHFFAEILLSIGELNPEDIGIEIIFAHKIQDEINDFVHKRELDVFQPEIGKAKYSCDIPSIKAGVYDFAFRVYPKHPDLAHRQDFNIVKWL